MNLIRKPFKYTYRNACLILVLVQCAIFVVFQLLSKVGLGSVESYFALVSPLTIHYKMFWQVFTYQFLHADIWHLLFNMLSLYIFGSSLEQKMGTKEFLLFYLLCGTLCGIAGAVIYHFVFLRTFMPVVVVGASGAIFSLLFAFATLFPDTHIFIWGIIPLPAPILILVYTGIEILGALSASDNIAHSIHLLGLVWAFLYVVIRFGINPIKVWKNNLR